jgi:hypothetical protein
MTAGQPRLMQSKMRQIDICTGATMMRWKKPAAKSICRFETSVNCVVHKGNREGGAYSRHAAERAAKDQIVQPAKGIGSGRTDSVLM